MKTHYHCSRCGAERPAKELNGIDVITGDDSNAYCIRVAQCNSPEAHQTINEVFEAIFGTAPQAQQAEGAQHG